METAINKWSELWDVLIDLSYAEREKMYVTMANEINACSHALRVVRRESYDAMRQAGGIHA